MQQMATVRIVNGSRGISQTDKEYFARLGQNVQPYISHFRCENGEGAVFRVQVVPFVKV